MSGKILIELDGVNVAIDGRSILKGIRWSLHEGENWLIKGPNGSGKTILLRLIRGIILPTGSPPGLRLYHIGGDVSGSPIGLEREMAYFGPDLQARYRRMHLDLKAEEIVLTGIWDGDFLHEKPSSAEIGRMEELFREFGMGDLRHEKYLRMSEGELRKVLILRALIAEPTILILDEVLGGLDASARKEMISFLEAMALRNRWIVMTSQREDEIPVFITHIARLEEGRMISQGRWVPGPGERETGRDSLPEIRRSERAPRRDRPPPLRIELRRVNLYLVDKRVLRDFDWVVEPGENWALRGPNGSGKTVLLKLVYGDYHAALGGCVLRSCLGRTLSVVEAREQIGWVSADLQTRSFENLNARQVVAGGFGAGVGRIEELSREQWSAVDESLERYCIDDLAEAPFDALSYGQARVVLLARAVVIVPALLLLDEPFEGLDAEACARVKREITDLAAKGVQLIMSTHHEEDFPRSITHLLELEGGRIRARTAL